jgi:hypothetical protein
MLVRATRLSDMPIIQPGMDARMGHNINGPSIVAMPDWAEARLGRYHLYFAAHKGTYIRLAYAEALSGPWQVHGPGVLDLKDSLFEPVDPPEPPAEDRPDWARRLKGDYLYAHIASPDVHVDHASRTIRLYYHGLLWNEDQQTRLAVSGDGLTFEPRAPLLAPPYFRAFQMGAFVYALTWGGEIWRAANWEGPFERGPQILPCEIKGGRGQGFRHGDVHRIGEALHLFYTRIGDRPERILHTQLQLDSDWMSWTAGRARTVLEPELAWEGADLPLRASRMGAVEARVRELRDPNVLHDDDGKTYLLYCGAGEWGIGIAELTMM